MSSACRSSPTSGACAPPAAYVTVPEAVFLIQDLGLPGQVGTQPFRAGPLFDGAQLATNLLLPESDDVAATFHVLALSPAEGAVIEIDDNPIRETKIVLSDGRTERRFARTEGLQIASWIRWPARSRLRGGGRSNGSERKRPAT